MAVSLVSYREWEASKPFATDQVSIHRLNVHANAGYDVWGRPKAQPVEISITISLAQAFTSAATSDTVDASTVHYGHLSKAIIAAVQDDPSSTWRSPLELVQIVADAARVVVAEPTVLSTLEILVAFPKASRFGDSVGLQLSYRPADQLTSTVLTLNNIRVASLVGVNAIERSMKQMVVITIAVDRISAAVTESNFELEQLVVKTAEESSFETLESLAEELAARTVKYFILPKQQFPIPDPAGVRVRIEKPSAITFADSPAVELYRSADSQDPFGKRMIMELGNKKPVIPFPLAGRLDEWLQSWKQD